MRSKLITALLLLTPFAAFGQKLTNKAIDTATEYTLWYNNGTVAPDYQRTVTITVTPDSVTRTISMLKGTTTESFSVSELSLKLFKENLKACKIKKRSKNKENTCCGGHSIGISLKSGDKNTFSASAYVGGGLMGGNLVGNEYEIKGCFEDLIAKSQK